MKNTATACSLKEKSRIHNNEFPKRLNDVSEFDFRDRIENVERLYSKFTRDELIFVYGLDAVRYVENS